MLGVLVRRAGALIALVVLTAGCDQASGARPPAPTTAPSPSPSPTGTPAAQALSTGLLSATDLPGATPEPGSSPPMRAVGTTFCGLPAPAVATTSASAQWALRAGGLAIETLTAFPSSAAATAHLSAEEQALTNCPQETLGAVNYNYAKLGAPLGPGSLLVGWSSPADSGFLATVDVSTVAVNVETTGASLSATEQVLRAAVSKEAQASGQQPVRD